MLVGTLIALSRMSADAEITAMRASGLSSRRLLQPVFAFAFVAMMITARDIHVAYSLSIRQTYKVLNKLIAAQLTAEIQPRVFAEQFPDTILYVGDVDARDRSFAGEMSSLPISAHRTNVRKPLRADSGTVRGSQQRARPSPFRISSAIAFSFR